MGDWTGESLKEAMAQRHARPSFVPLQAFTNNQWATKVKAKARSHVSKNCVLVAESQF